jgi:uncharacterized protein YbbC (DUF1343 family)
LKSKNIITPSQRTYTHKWIGIFVLNLFWGIGSFPALGESKVLTGLDRVGVYGDWFTGKRVGIITNHTGRDRDGRFIVEIFRAQPGVKVTALFTPEHGIFGTADAGEKVTDIRYEGIPAYSLYGKTKKPTAEMLSEVDVLVYDIQDVGVRYYTYISTLALALEAAAENGKQFVVLDRPNPLNGVTIEGNILEPKFASFVGMHPTPVRHGMTVGELANMMNGEGWLAKGVRADLKIIPMTDWKRGMWFEQTGLKFMSPSPNMKTLDTAVIYPGTCLLEGTNVSEGRGTKYPFLQFGAPWLKQGALIEELQKAGLQGLSFQPVLFTPSSSKFKDQPCRGVRIQITNRNTFDAFRFGIVLVKAIYDLHPEEMKFYEGHFDRLCGTDAIRKTIANHQPLNALFETWRQQIEVFRKIRRKYLLYERR